MRSKLIVWRNLLLATLFQSTTTRVTEMSSSRFGNCDQSAWPCETDDLERWIEDALEDIRRIFESCPTDYKCVYKECPPYGNLDYRRSVPQLSGSVCEPMWTRVAVMLFDRLITNCTRIFEFGGGASTPWLLARAEWVSTVDSSEWWHKRVKQYVEAFCIPYNYRFAQHYVKQGSLATSDEFLPDDPQDKYDFVIVDGIERNITLERAVHELLKEDGGILMLDDSERMYAAETIVPKHWRKFELPEDLFIKLDGYIDLTPWVREQYLTMLWTTTASGYFGSSNEDPAIWGDWQPKPARHDDRKGTTIWVSRRIAHGGHGAADPASGR